MEVSVFGTGYVGLVTAACLADAGHQVVCADVDRAKIEKLRGGEVLIREPGIGDMVAMHVATGALRFTSEGAEAVAHGKVLFIAVGTPMAESGDADLSDVLEVADGIARHIDGHRVVAIKSTVPVGTADRVASRIAGALARRGSHGAITFDVVSNPEFLREGAAVQDFMKPDRILIGAASEQAASIMLDVYASFDPGCDRTIVTDIRSSELSKYAANAFLATKVSFINEIANLAERMGADIEAVREAIGADPRIGPHFLNAGMGYGGSCLPKDVKALVFASRRVGYEPELVAAVDKVNDRQKQALYGQIERAFGGRDSLEGRVIAIWGLSFKPGTDDMREAPSRALMEALWEAGAAVRAHDPVAIEEARRIHGQRAGLSMFADKYDALDGADALAICTEWNEYGAPDFARMEKLLRRRMIFDGRNMFDPADAALSGWIYRGVGRGAATATGAHDAVPV